MFKRSNTDFVRRGSANMVKRFCPHTKKSDDVETVSDDVARTIAEEFAKEDGEREVALLEAFTRLMDCFPKTEEAILQAIRESDGEELKMSHKELAEKY